MLRPTTAIRHRDELNFSNSLFKGLLVGKAFKALFSLERGRVAYWADLGIYGAAVTASAIVLAVHAPRERWPMLTAFAVLGVFVWTLIEYALHRFVLHGLEPFRSWHAEHHERPMVLMSTPTLLSLSLFALLVFLPMLLAAGAWPALAVTLGVMAGYLAYSVIHHATHHYRSRGTWMADRKRWHARHHHGTGCYGVSSSFWDRLFGSTGGETARPAAQPQRVRTLGVANSRPIMARAKK
jgi:sterol desaturase/sphingolipid hydroxylase (fatty acid hydroxylase superfamily)